MANAGPISINLIEFRATLRRTLLNSVNVGRQWLEIRQGWPGFELTVVSRRPPACVGIQREASYLELLLGSECDLANWGSDGPQDACDSLRLLFHCEVQVGSIVRCRSAPTLGVRLGFCPGGALYGRQRSRDRAWPTQSPERGRSELGPGASGAYLGEKAGLVVLSGRAQPGRLGPIRFVFLSLRM